MAGQTLSPDTFLEHQNTKADKSCECHCLPRSHQSSWKNGMFLSTQINLLRVFLAGKEKEYKAGHARAPLTLVGPPSDLSPS